MLLQEKSAALEPQRDLKWREERKVEYFMNRMCTRLNFNKI